MLILSAIKHKFLTFSGVEGDKTGERLSPQPPPALVGLTLRGTAISRSVLETSKGLGRTEDGSGRWQQWVHHVFLTAWGAQERSVHPGHSSSSPGACLGWRKGAQKIPSVSVSLSSGRGQVTLQKQNKSCFPFLWTFLSKSWPWGGSTVNSREPVDTEASINVLIYENSCIPPLKGRDISKNSKKPFGPAAKK